MQDFMEVAIDEAKKALALSEVPVGAVVVMENRIIARSHNLSIANSDATAHGEMLALQSASQILQSRYLTDCDLYVTLEPCPMCAYAISLARIKRLYFGAYDFKSGGVEHGLRVYDNQNTHHKPDYYGGIKEQRCSKLMRDFFLSLRS